MLAAYLSGGSVVKGLIMVVVGLALGCVGIDPISGKFRFAYGVLQLQDGFDFVTIAMGLFGLVRDLHQPRDSSEDRAGHDDV